MKKNLTKALSALTLASVILFLAGREASAQEQQKEPDMMELAEKEADRLADLLDLEDWQTFYVDSTLKHNYRAMEEEYMQLRNAKVSNTDMYYQVRDKWMEETDRYCESIFTPEQWALYIKSGVGKERKAREKRRQKAEKLAGKMRK